jgi:hypothetical protein
MHWTGTEYGPVAVSNTFGCRRSGGFLDKLSNFQEEFAPCIKLFSYGKSVVCRTTLKFSDHGRESLYHIHMYLT